MATTPLYLIFGKVCPPLYSPLSGFTCPGCIAVHATGVKMCLNFNTLKQSFFSRLFFAGKKVDSKSCFDIIFLEEVRQVVIVLITAYMHRKINFDKNKYKTYLILIKC